MIVGCGCCGPAWAVACLSTCRPLKHSLESRLVSGPQRAARNVEPQCSLATIPAPQPMLWPQPRRDHSSAYGRLGDRTPPERMGRLRSGRGPWCGRSPPQLSLWGDRRAPQRMGWPRGDRGGHGVPATHAVATAHRMGCGHPMDCVHPMGPNGHSVRGTAGTRERTAAELLGMTRRVGKWWPCCTDAWPDHMRAERVVRRKRLGALLASRHGIVR